MLLSRLHCFFLNHNHFRQDHVDDTTIAPDKHSDTLFGCFYILTYGVSEYQKHTHMTNRSLDRQLKFQCIEYLSKRITGSKKTATDIHYETQLGVCDRIDLYTFFGLCEAYNSKVIFINGNRYYAVGMDGIVTTTVEYQETYVSVLCISDEPSYYLKTVSTRSIPWNDLYRLHTLESPLPPARTLSKNDIIQILYRFTDTSDTCINDMNREKKTHLYARAQTLLKLI
jgi:hypothetical protein